MSSSPTSLRTEPRRDSDPVVARALRPWQSARCATWLTSRCTLFCEDVEPSECWDDASNVLVHMAGADLHEAPQERSVVFDTIIILGRT